MGSNPLQRYNKLCTYANKKGVFSAELNKIQSI